MSAINICIRRSSRKLDLKYYGLFPITEQIDKQAHKPKLRDSVGRIHPVFHVSLLEPCSLTTQINTEEPGAQLEVRNKEQQYTEYKI
jgi:hypothetical protein